MKIGRPNSGKPVSPSRWSGRPTPETMGRPAATAQPFIGLSRWSAWPGVGFYRRLPAPTRLDKEARAGIAGWGIGLMGPPKTVGNLPDWTCMQARKRLFGPSTLFVDVGANVGTYSLWAAELGATVISVEPNGEARSQLLENAALNG